MRYRCTDEVRTVVGEEFLWESTSGYESSESCKEYLVVVRSKTGSRCAAVVEKQTNMQT